MKTGRLAIVVAMGALAATLVPAASAQACAGSSRGAAIRYYHEINAHRFGAAWSCLSASSRRQLGGYSRWRRGYRGLAWVRIRYVRLLDQASGTAELSASIRSCRRVGGSALRERFAGRWAVLNGFAGWRLYRPRIQRIGSVRRSGC